MNTSLKYSAARFTIRNNKALLWACHHRSLRWLVIGVLQACHGHSFEEAEKACDLEMGYNQHYGWLRA